ncbi:MAG TPA: LysE family transporter [Polyangiaceae bacterium]
MIIALLLGFVLAFAGSMPIAGPISVLVLNRSLQDRHREAFSLALGAAIAEGVYAFVAFWGLSSVLLRFPMAVPAARLAGAFLLIGIGIYFAIRRPSEKKPPEKTNGGDGRGWLPGFAVTLANPTLILTWTTVVTALHSMFSLRVEPIDAVPFALGVVAGIVAWFGSLIWLIRRFKHHLAPGAIDAFIRVLGWIMITTGAVAGWRAIRLVT